MKRNLTCLAGWLCAALALGLVFWLRPDREKKGGVAAEGNGPRVTKPYLRERDAREQRTKNPREEFEAARKRGLTEEEVRGIVEEFMRTGIGSIDLSNTSERELLDNRKAENSWYLLTLVEGLRLTPDQQREAAEKLHKTRVYGYSAFLAKIAKAAPTIDFDPIPDEAIIDPDPFAYGDEEAYNVGSAPLGYYPRDLCELDRVQMEILGLRIEGEKLIWPRPGSYTLDFGTEEKYENLDDPFGEHHISVTDAGYIFPLSMDQVDRILAVKGVKGLSEDGENGSLYLLENAKALSSAQLRTLLLKQPSIVEILLKGLGE